MTDERGARRVSARFVHHASAAAAMVAIAAAVAVAVGNLFVHMAHSAAHAAGIAHPHFDLVSVSVAVVFAVASLTALTLATVGSGRRGGRCRIAWVSPGLGAIANASVWATIAALAVVSAAEAFAPLPGGHLAACAVLAGGLGAVTGIVHRRAHHQPIYRSFNLVAMLLAAGALASMSLTRTGAWWALNFSTLGTSDDVAATWFNAGLVFSGAGMAVMAGPLSRGLARPEHRARRAAPAVVQTLIGVIGISLAGVGLVPIDADEVVHNVFASAAGAAFFVLAAGTPWMVERMPRRLRAASFASLGLEAAAWIAYDRLGWASLTVFEVVAFALVFVWLITLVVTTHPEREPSLGAAAEAIRAGGVVLGPAIRERVRTATVPVMPLAGGAPGMAPRLVRSS
ncbi:DUF998 domain-containing protein [Agromyces marinus]|uniref:DUF998 domain-containing protein n=1 Tax=Agromyces marinus TaxID=1389020 RepID=A0ABM8H104_9MICO|nr:DUF998 domain-containing protein [Agromyces marinus]UIP57438.1 hypothetical protein DSM26151_02960 [Agromyces marinus]BDZ54435.1 hypothetical protein GCM10025870_15080 [Agromyces marinus]